MKMRSPLLRLSLALAAAFALAACFGDPAGPTEFPSGSVRFSYVRTDTAGTPLGDSLAFAAEGAVSTDNYFSGTYAFGLLSTTFSDSTAVRVYGQQARDEDETYDGLHVLHVGSLGSAARRAAAASAFCAAS